MPPIHCYNVEEYSFDTPWVAGGGCGMHMAVDLGETLGFLLAGAVWWLVKFYYGSYVNVSSYMLYR